MAKDIEVKVKYIPDTSALKSVMNGAQNIDFKIGGNGLKKELLSPIQNAMKEVNKAMASGASNTELLKLFKNVNIEADKVRQRINLMSTELNAGFNSVGNQQMLKQLEQYRKELEKVEKESNQWTKKYGNATISKLKTNAGVKSSDQARKDKASLEAEIQAGKELTAQDQARLAALKEYVDTLEERNRLQKQGITSGSFEEQRREIVGKIDSTEKNVQTAQFNASATKEFAAVQTYVGNTAAYATGEINKLSASIKTEKDIANEGKKELTKFGDVVAGTFLGTSLGNLFQTGLSRGIQFFKEYDETLTRTMMVTGMTRDEVNGLTESYNKLANQLSSTTKDVAAAQLVFYQQGLGTKEALDMTEASIAISKTGGIEAAEAANRLTAAVRGYQLAASDSMAIADKMSALDAAAASSVDELTIAMQKSASQARMAGLDLDYYMAYLSTMQEVTREAPENIGTAMKSITSRMQEIRDIGKIEEDGTTFSNVAKALNSIGIAATDSSGQLRSLQDIMNELGPMWATLDRNHKAYIATTLAGNRQQSRFIALMDNYDRAMELVNVSQNANGESAKQLRAYNQGLEASFTALSNALQQFATKLADSEVIKTLVDLLTDLIELVNKLPDGFTKTVVPMGVLLKTFTTLSKVDFKSFKTWFGEKTGIDTFIKQTDNLNKTLDKTPKFLKEFYGAFKEGKGIVSENADAIEDSSSTIESNSAIVGTNIAARETLNAEVLKESTTLSSNDAIKADETVENAAIMTSQTRLGEAVENVNDELREQNALFGINDGSKKQKIATDLDETTNQLSMLRNRRETAIGKQDALKGEMNERLSKARSDYDARADVFVRQFRAAEKLGIKNYQPVLAENKKDLFATLEAQAFTSKGNPKRTTDGKNAAKILEQLKKDYHEIGVEYNQLQRSIKGEYFNVDDKNDRYSGLLGVGNKEIDDIDKQIKKLQNKKKKIQKELSKQVEIPKQQPGTGLLADLKNIGSDQNLTGIQKLGKGFGTLSKSVGGFSGILSNVAIGAMVSMGAETIGLDKDLSGALGTFTGLGKTLSGFGPWGWAAAAAVAGLQFAFKKLYPSVEDVQAKLTELATEKDNITQKITDIETAKETYEDLGRKLNKTEEEQEAFNNAVEVLQKEVPGAVSGYDSMGNAIINLTKVTKELNRQQEQLIANSKKTLGEFTKLQKAEGSDGWKIAADIYSVLEYINPATLLPKLIEDGTGLSFTLSGFIQDKFIKPKELEANKKVWAENFSEIYGSLQTMVADTVDNGTAANQELRQKVSDSILNAFTVDGMADGAKVEDVQKEIEELYGKFHYGDLDAITTITEQVGVNAEITDKSWSETEEMIRKQLEARLKTLDLTDEEYKLLLKATVTMAYAGEVDLSSIFEQIDAEVARREGDYEFQINAQRFKSALGDMDASVVKVMNDMNLLNSTMIGLFDEYKNVEDIEALFKGPNGEIDKQRAGLLLLDKAYGELQAEQEAHKLEGEGGLYEQESNKKAEIEAKKKEIEQLKEEKRIAESYANDVGYGYYDSQLDNQINPALSKAEQELKALEGEWEDINQEITNSENAVKDYEAVIDQLVASFESVEAPSFDSLAETIRGIADELKSVQDLAASLDEQSGKMSLDNIADMFDIIGNYEDAAMSNAQTWDLWNQSIEQINAGLSVQNGELIAQEGVMQGLNNLTQVSAKIKMQEIEASIQQNQLELQLQNAALQTQANAIEAALAKLRAGEDAAEAEKAIDDSLAELDANLNAVKTQNAADSFDQILSYTSHFAKQYSKIMAAAYTGNYDGEYESIDASYTKILNSFKKDLGDELKKDIIDGDNAASIKNLEGRLNQINAQISQNNKNINNTLELKKKISSYLADDTTNLAGQVDKTTEAQKEYNEKLERTLTLLEKIAGLQHTIDENETFKSLYEGYDGESYGRIMMSNLKLAQEQYGVYKDLFAMQQEMTNQAAGDLLDSPYGEMFTIAENGDLGWASDEMYDKYKGLPEDMQEDIDNLVEAYQNQRDELRDTEQELAVYAEAVKKAREELVEMEIEIENELVDALKNREKIMHEARTKAIDDEIKMIEEAVEARKKAREEDESEKELFQAQEALRRATLDSSGKNNAQLLQLQQDLEDKQLEISEKRFEDDMEDRKNWLQDTKDAETETYEHRLETMTWYWENVQAIQEAGQEAMMQTLIHWNEEYRKTSELQQSEMLREWQFTMDAMRTATDMGAELEQLTNDIVSVTSEVESMNISIDKLPGTWQKATDAANNYMNAAKQASSYKFGGAGAEFNNTGDTGKEEKTKIPKYISTFGIGDTVTVKDGNWSLTTKYNDNFGSVGSTAGWNLKNVKVTDIKFDKNKEQFYYKFDKFGDWWYKGHQFNLVKDAGGQKTEIYKKGGIVDYTGPAWVDGTKTQPEAFLNPYQTQQIGALAEALDSKSINSANMNSNVTFGSINFNVASMSSAADGKKALEMFVQGANDLMAKKGIGTKLNMNVK